MYEMQNNDLKCALPIGVIKHYRSNASPQTFSCKRSRQRSKGIWRLITDLILRVRVRREKIFNLPTHQRQSIEEKVGEDHHEASLN